MSKTEKTRHKTYIIPTVILAALSFFLPLLYSYSWLNSIIFGVFVLLYIFNFKESHKYLRIMMIVIAVLNIIISVVVFDPSFEGSYDTKTKQCTCIGFDRYNSDIFDKDAKKNAVCAGILINCECFSWKSNSPSVQENTKITTGYGGKIPCSQFITE